MNNTVQLPPPVHDALQVWLRHHDELAPGLIEGLYLVGSVALGNWQPSSDIDIIAVTADAPTGAEVAAMNSAHTATVDEVGPIDIDGPRLAWADLARAPAPVLRPWTLHGDFHHSEGCFDINAVMWFTLAKHGIAVRGPEVGELDIAADPEELRRFVRENTAGYWRSDADSIMKALEDPNRMTFDSALTSWSVLGIARMMYTVRTGGITSKSGAGEWLLTQLPQHKALIDHALAIRIGNGSPPDGRQITEDTATLIYEVADLVAAADPKAGSSE